MSTAMADDDLLIRVGNPIASPNAPGRAAVFELGGWERIRVQRSCEQFPSAFEVVATERFPGDNVSVSVNPGDPCQVLITRGLGRDVVLTGYVDQVIPAIDASHHEITISGRGKCEDLVDCSAVWFNGQFSNMSPLTIAQNLARPFGISVSQASGGNSVNPQLIMQWSETPYELIERVARYAGLLVYEDENGNLILSRVGAAKMSTGFVEGKNVIRAVSRFTMDERFSEYRVRRLTFDTLSDTGANPEGDIIATVTDGGVPRFRPKYIIAETPQGMGNDYGIARGEWEANRRFGRSTQIHLTADSWRDGDGNLWAPNSLVDIDLPSVKLGGAQHAATQWVISTVTFRRDERGTEADLVIMPANAFDILMVPITPLLNAGPY